MSKGGDSGWSDSRPSCAFRTFPTPSTLSTLAGNESAYEPNGAECYSCVGLSREACQGTAPPVVSCYNASDHFYKGCFDGNVTLTAGELALKHRMAGVVVAFLKPARHYVSLYSKGSSSPTLAESCRLNASFVLECPEKFGPIPGIA